MPEWKTAAASYLSRIAGLAWASVFPPVCRMCGTSLWGCERAWLCRGCAEKVLAIGDNSCRFCGFPGGAHSMSTPNCWRCRGRDLPFTRVAGAVRYLGPARALVKALKFGGETKLAVPIAEAMARRCRLAGIPACHLIMPVPIHDVRRRERGFNQAELLGRELSTPLGVPMVVGALRRIRPTAPQSGLRMRERWDNPKGAFAVTNAVAGKWVLLVDDVMTTGATLGECARVCRESGAERVYALVFAR